MIDVKKLVTGFLVLAVAASAAALIVSAVGGSNATAIVADAIGTQGTSTADTNQSGADLSGTAFLPQPSTGASNNSLAVDPDGDPLASYPALDASSSDPGNLTSALANAYMTDLMTANPQGPTVDSNGNQALTPPDNTAIISQLENNVTSSADLQIPDWDAEAAEVPVITTATTSPDAISDYSSAIQAIFNQDFVEPNVESMLNDNSDPSAAGYIEPKIQSALQDIAGLQTPRPLVSFQKSLITYLVYGKNTLALADGVSSSSDPLKTALVLQAETQKYDSVAQNLKSQLQTAAALTGFAPFAMNTTQPAAPTPTGAVALIDNVLGIKTAHAIFGLGDITFDPSIFAQTLISYAENIALQIAKNIIISIMQKTVLTWVRGNGVPRFVQQWGTTLVNAYTNAAVNALNSQFACVNPAYKAQLQILLKIPTPTSGVGGVCASQFSSALTGANLKNFYNNFSSGGFVSYMAVFQPSGNLFGSAIDAQDAAMNAGLDSYASVQTKSIANQGWNGSETCGDQSDPNGTHYFCNGGDSLYQGNDGNMYCNDSPAPPYPATLEPNNGLCADGSEPQTTAPGQVTGQVFNSAVDSSGKLTAAASDIAGLLDAFMGSLLNSIASNLITVTTGAIQNIGSTGTGAPGSGQSGSVPISCTPTFQDPGSPYSVTFIGAGGQTTSLSGSQVTTSQPTYSWSVQDASGAVIATGVGGQFTTTFNASGTYLATITDTNPADGNASAQCSTNAPAPSQ